MQYTSVQNSEIKNIAWTRWVGERSLILKKVGLSFWLQVRHKLAYFLYQNLHSGHFIFYSQ